MRPTFAVLLLSLGIAACGDDDRAPIADVTTAGAAAPYADCYDPDQHTATSVDDHACSWLHQALTLQDRLDRARPLNRGLWLATHNSFNSSVYPGFSSNDPNQSLSLLDQLRLDMRGIELDVHWIPHAASGGYAPVLCHGLGAEMLHFGCTPLDRHLREGLAEVADFLARPENREVVLMLDIEDQLNDFVPPNGSAPNAAAHDLAITEIEQALGERIYRPAADGTCHPLPLELSKAQVLAAGKQVLITAGCGAGTTWTSWVFDIGAVRKQKANDGFDAYPDCESAFFSTEDYATRFTRIWHDSTQLSAQTSPGLVATDAAQLTEMLRCGVNMPSLDLLRPDDARATAMVWSWAPAEPRLAATPRCALSGDDGHFHAADCADARRYACRDGSAWRVTTAAGNWAGGAAACAAEFGAQASFAVTATGLEQQVLIAAGSTAGADEIWLNYRDSSGLGQWQ